MLLYVDDIIVTDLSSPRISALISKLNAEFALKQLGDLDYFLGIEIKRLPSGSLLLSQSKYIKDLLSKANMAEAKSLPTPMVSNCKLTKYGANYMDNPTLYRSVVGAMQYATITRPEISFSVSNVCQFLSQPLEEHWKAVKRILRYLQGTTSYGLLLKPAMAAKPFTLQAFSDADWGADLDDRRSMSGSCV